MRHPAVALLLLPAITVALAPPARGEEPRDPFASILNIEEPAPAARAPLERYRLEQLQLTGIVVGTASPKALIETPDGQGHVARIGDPVGHHGARILKITRDGITLVDTWHDAIGGVHRDVSRWTVRAP